MSQSGGKVKKKAKFFSFLLVSLFGVVALAMSVVYLWQPSFVSNFVSAFPARIVHLPLNLSLQNQNFEAVAQLLEKQRTCRNVGTFRTLRVV